MGQYTQLGEEQSINKSLTINAAAEEIISNPVKRKSITFRNISTGGQIITISFSNNVPAVAGTGYVLNVNDVLIDSSSEGYKCWTGRIRAISSAIGGTLAVVEMQEENI